MNTKPTGIVDANGNPVDDQVAQRLMPVFIGGQGGAILVRPPASITMAGIIAPIVAAYISKGQTQAESIDLADQCVKAMFKHIGKGAEETNAD
jgi:DNA-binding IscR family transcriptional regulator